jgi:putative ABC transport system permease protein
LVPNVEKQPHMLRHYFRIAIRNLGRHKVLTVINILGLSLGLACFSLILVFAVNEFSYDNWHVKAARIYRVDETFVRKDGQTLGSSGGNMPVGPALKQDFPDVEDAVRISASDEKLMKGNNGTMRLDMSFADPGFFTMFSFPLVSGAPAQVLLDPHDIVVTRSKAIQLFGTTDAVGKTVQIKFDTTYRPFKVSGVAADLPKNSSVTFDIMGSFDYLLVSDSNRLQAVNKWHRTYGDMTWLLLKPGSRLMSDSNRLLQFRWKHMPEELDSYHKEKKVMARYALQPLLTVHTDPTIMGPGVEPTDPANIWILLGIASGILLIASINFTTLAIARSASRAVEVGVRKVLGGHRSQLVRQFLAESVLLSVISTILGCLLAIALLPWFNELSDKQLSFSFFEHPQLAWMLAGLTLLVGLLAGCYPALVLSGFRPVDVLKSRIRLGGSNYFTRSLVTLQFVLSIGLIIGTTIILRQVNFMRNKDLGLIKENTVVVLPRDVDAAKGYDLLRQALASDPRVAGVTASELGLGEGRGMMNDMYMFNGVVSSAIVYPVATNFLSVMGLHLLAGRGFDATITSDTVSNVVVNETLVSDYLGVTPAEAVGKRFKSLGGGVEQYKTIIGVVRDFNFERLNRKVRPQLFYVPAQLDPRDYFIHLRGGDPTPTLAAISAFWKGFAPDVPLRTSFLDEDLNRFYKSEVRWGNIIAAAGGISIFLACMGLFGLAALAAINRIKEIGIRRVLGASGFEIVGLLTGDFLQLVVVASLIASPLAWYIMNKWLQHFAYRIEIGGSIFALTALAALAIAYVTIGVQAWRAARINPVESLRAE